MPDSARCLALLIAAPLRGESAMHGDVQSVYEAFRQRGVSPEDLLVLEGRLSRDLLLGALEAIRSRVAGWMDGDVFLYFSGHGAYAPLDAIDATAVEPALVFAQEEMATPARWLFWREVFATLVLPPRVRLALLPDC
jgi:hypothetical protein